MTAEGGPQAKGQKVRKSRRERRWWRRREKEEEEDDDDDIGPCRSARAHRSNGLHHDCDSECDYVISTPFTTHGIIRLSVSVRVYVAQRIVSYIAPCDTHS
ncbi:hypothetical protein K491DRAFT_697398 [Lophiostoma macrostomum CBS 122681]|uniref:Uncharacterized protein n=1 Tax=Lophiostoma macrostomum CBS 122681 TaxID=1314788 RepID=A0A6A6SUN8_9PLEO|nr:hypothetical protein K491DRAFT_697398 [Lophiostoma macrostomum CBS 122681]